MSNPLRAAHRVPSDAEDPEPGMPPIDPDDGIVQPGLVVPGDSDAPLDPAP